MNDRTNKEETDHLDNPTYMMHKHGIDIDKYASKVYELNHGINPLGILLK